MPVRRTSCGYSLPFIFVNYAQTHLLVALGLLRSMVLLAAVCFVVNLGALAMLVPRYGTLGAAVAKLATEVLLCVAAYPIIQGRTRSGSR